MLHEKQQVGNFLSSPIKCVACERTELLKTEISGRFFVVVVHLSSKTDQLFSIWIIFGTYGMYTYGMYSYGMYTYGMDTYGMYLIFIWIIFAVY